MEQGGSFEPAGASRRNRIESATDVISVIIQELDALPPSAFDTADTNAALVATARRICDAARRDGLYIEQAIVRVKTAWRATPGRPKPRPGSTDAHLDQLVSCCIREFYSER